MFAVIPNCHLQPSRTGLLGEDVHEVGLSPCDFVRGVGQRLRATTATALALHGNQLARQCAGNGGTEADRTLVPPSSASRATHASTPQRLTVRRKGASAPIEMWCVEATERLRVRYPIAVVTDDERRPQKKSRTSEVEYGLATLDWRRRVLDQLLRRHARSTR